MMMPRKSPNMMSTIGRMPVIAAPTPRPVKPASEIGVSMTRSLPNSSTRPVNTLNVVPASATSSPIRTTRGSRRISSAIASLIASPNVSSRSAVAVSGIDVLVHLAGIRIRRVHRKVHRTVHFLDQLFLNRVERRAIGDAVGHQPLAMQRDRIALRDPLLLLRLWTVVGAGDVADVVAVIAIGDALNKGRSLEPTSPLDVLRDHCVDLADVLAVDRFRGQTERLGSLGDLARG